MIRELKKDLCPSDEDWKELVRYKYREVLQRPLTSLSQTPQDWLYDWNHAHANALLLSLPEVEGTLAIKDFLRSAYKYYGDWALRELDKLSCPGTTATISLQDYARWFAEVVQTRPRHEGVYATLGSIPTYRCPCRPSGQHRWQPTECNRLQYALQGETTHKLQTKPTSEETQAIKRRLQEDQWKALLDELRQKGWVKEPLINVVFPGSILA